MQSHRGNNNRLTFGEELRKLDIWQQLFGELVTFMTFEFLIPHYILTCYFDKKLHTWPLFFHAIQHLIEATITD